MIQETIVTSISASGTVHIAPMGVHVEGDSFVILPFKPSTTLNNIVQTGHAVMNHCDDVRIFAGCLTGRRDWPLKPCESIAGYYLADTLTHIELSMLRLEDDPIRPRLACKAVHTGMHRPFPGFNRAQFAVLEAAILLSRLDRLPWQKIQTELDYLRIAVDKCAGDRELEAWGWLMQAMEEHKQTTVAP
ncbi:MAG: DUF447 family protein [Methylomonas sp.]|nr:DUF447 family protein [Methylomonas sp.]